MQLFDAKIMFCDKILCFLKLTNALLIQALYFSKQNKTIIIKKSLLVSHNNIKQNVNESTI